MSRYYYTNHPDDYSAYCVDAESAIKCGKELECGGFWVRQYEESREDAPLAECTFVGKIYIEN